MPETVTKSIRYDFSESELHDLAMDLANRTKELKAVTDEKKEVNKKYNKSIGNLKAFCDDLSNLVADGYEYRDIPCQVQYHKPAQGQMTVTRTDTGEVFTEQMTEEDWNLFNQA